MESQGPLKGGRESQREKQRDGSWERPGLALLAVKTEKEPWSTDSLTPLGLPEGTLPCGQLDCGPVRPKSHF